MTVRVLMFDIWADYAHFKKYYTTTSPLTFSIPPKTVIYGILGAILGLDKDTYLKSFYCQCKIGIQILQPVKKVRMGLNLIDTKKGWHKIENRTQIRTEFLKEPAYRLYISHTDPVLHQRLHDLIQAHCCYYTVSLGLTENLANFAYVGEVEAVEMSHNQNWVDLVTVFRVDDGNVAKGMIDFTEKGKEYFSDTLALEMNSDREVKDYGQVIFERKGNTIKAKPDMYYQLPDGTNLLFL